MKRALVAGALALGCGVEPSAFRETPDAARDASLDANADVWVPPVSDVAPVDRAGSDAPPVTDNVRVYAHTSRDLYVVDPRALTVTRVGAFAFPDDFHNHEMTDLAVTATEELWGISFDAVYRIDRATARCTFVTALQGNYNGLTFVPAGILGSAEVLVAASQGGDYVLIDTRDGRASRIGSYGPVTGSSGDLVSIAGAETYATVTRGDTEYLARINPRSGAATIVGATGVSNTWGLGYWRSRLYGFTSLGQFVTIDIATGRATVVMQGGPAWWGAGVTTIAPVAPP